MNTGFLTALGQGIKTPGNNMSWTQLAAATVFVFVVFMAWRQVSQFIMGEL